MLVLWIWPNKCGDCGVESSESCLLWWIDSVDRLIQPTAQKQDSYLKDTTDLLNFIESTKLPKNTLLVSTPTYHTKRLKPYVTHTKIFMGIKSLYLPST